MIAHHSSGAELPVPANSARGIMRSPASRGLATANMATRSSAATDFIDNAAAWLILQQRPDGSFPLTVGGSVAVNTISQIAPGLIQAFRRTGNTDYIDAATRAGEFLLANLPTYPISGKTRFSVGDPLFLMELSRATGDQRFRNLVNEDFWNRLEAGIYGANSDYDASDFIQALFRVRGANGELVARDASLLVVAAHLDGRNTIAQSFLDGIIESLEGVPSTGPAKDFEIFGLAGAVWAAARIGAELDPTQGKWAASDSTLDLANALVGFQHPDGGILFNSAVDPLDANNQVTQLTALTLVGLDLLDRTAFAQNIADAGDYLLAQQQLDGQILISPDAVSTSPGGVAVHGESMVAWVSSQMRPGLIESVTATGDTPTAIDNDYTRINNPVQMAIDGDVIQLSGTFDWTEPNAFNSWVNGSDGIAATGDDFGILYPAGRSGITLTSATLGDAVIVGPGDLASQNLEAFVYVASAENRNLEFSNLQIEGFDLSIGMFFVPGQGVNLYDGTRIINNHIIMPTDIAGSAAAGEDLQNIGIHFAFGDNQLIADNIIDIPGDGSSTPSTTSANVAMQSNRNSGAFEGLVIENNKIRILNAPTASPQNIIGIWENSSASDRNIIIRNNSFVNLDPSNDPLNNRQQGFRITSQRNTTTGNGALMTGNLAQGANIGYAWLSFASFGADFSSSDPLDFIANTAIDNAIGIRLDSNGSANFKCNIISGNATDGILNINQDPAILSDATVNWWGCNDGPGTGSCDRITGSGVDGLNWLLFELEANPVRIVNGGNSSLTASLLNTFDGNDSLTLAGCTVPDGQDIEFAGGAFGNFDPTMGTLIGGFAGSTYTATSEGVANDITATINAGQTATTTILIVGAGIFADGFEGP